MMKMKTKNKRALQRDPVVLPDSMRGRRWLICFITAEEIEQAAYEMAITDEQLTEQAMEEIAHRFSSGVDGALWKWRDILKASIREVLR